MSNQVGICLFVYGFVYLVMIATFVVSPLGDDSSTNGPFKTLNKAFESQPPLDPVLYITIEKGRYELEQPLTFNTKTMGKLYLIATDFQETIINCNFDSGK